MKDLFEPKYFNNLSKEVRALFNQEEYSYEELRDKEKEAKKLGYIFDWGLDAVPYNLRKI